MTKATKAAGERLPYLLGKLKAPRVLERLEQTAATARAGVRGGQSFIFDG